MNETRTLARWLAKLRFTDLPAPVVDYTQRFLLDDIGCMLGGAIQLGNKALLRDVIALDEVPQCTVAVYGHKTSPTTAALVNGAFICGWDYDNQTMGGVHMASQTAALLAMAEREGIDGKAILTAECAGIEAHAHIGMATDGVGEHVLHPWHSNTALGPFAAAVTTGKILGFDAHQMEDVIGLATHTLGGNYQHYNGWGSSMKRVRCGIGAWNGVRAALLVNAGITGPSNALEGRHGFLEAMHGQSDAGISYYEPNYITDGLGDTWYTLTYTTKGFGVPCVTGLQTPCVTAIALRNKHHIRHEDIASVMIEHCARGDPTKSTHESLIQTDQLLGTMLGRTPAQRLASAGWSRRWMVALCLVLGAGGIREQLNNVRPYGRYREIEALSEKIEGRVNQDYYDAHFTDRPYPNFYGGRVIITLNDGRCYEHEPLPHLGCRMSDGTVHPVTYPQLVDKLREQAPLAGISEDKQDRIIQITTHMAAQESITPLIRNIIR
jgi:2-methylcitrate dehydratase PrpD